MAAWISLTPSLALAQEYIWARQLSGPLSVEAKGVALDSSGNVYTVGVFAGTADFDPGPGTLNLASLGGQDVFVTKLDSSGNLGWAKQLGGVSNDDYATEVAVDISGNVYTVGVFGSTVDFDPGPEAYNLTSAGVDDGFISKLDGAGNFVWAKQLGGVSYDDCFGVALDRSSNVYIVGRFYGTVDFDPGPGTHDLISGGGYDAFILKLDSAGNFVWAKHPSGLDHSQAESVAVDTNGDVYTAGLFLATVDFDPGPGTYDLTSAGGADAFISKLDSTGNFVWARQTGDTLDDYAYGIAVDASGSAYTVGNYEGIQDAFIIKHGSVGNLIWATQLSSSGLGVDAYSVAVDIGGTVYIVGGFGATVDFDPGPGSYALTSLGGRDTYVLKLDSVGDFVWAKQFTGLGASDGWAVAVDTISNVYTAGRFNITEDFDPGAGTYDLTSVGLYDCFISKLGPWTSDADNDGFSPAQGDCNDGNAAIHPAAQEICDGLDNDCDGAVDEGCDDDGDDYCDDLMATIGQPPACPQGGGDCNDANNSVFPGAPERCDQIDNDCDALIDWADPGLDPTIDSDADGLYDCWETYGIDADNPFTAPSVGGIDLPIHQPPLTANRLVPDIFIEIDYMSCEDGGCDPGQEHLSRKPLVEALERVRRVFADHGINLHYDVDEPVRSTYLLESVSQQFDPYQYGLYAPSTIANICNQDPTTVYFGKLADRMPPTSRCASIITARSWVFRYALFANKLYAGATGIARRPSANPQVCSRTGFIVGMADVTDIATVHAERWRSSFKEEWIDYQSATFMHELGHTLGLEHGGSEPTNCKPNYLSVMNYTRQFDNAAKSWGVPGVGDLQFLRLDRELNYSDGPPLPTLNETTLNELSGVGADPTELVLFGSTILFLPVARVGPAGGPIDWDLDGILENQGETVDINSIPFFSMSCDGGNDLGGSLLGFDDWARVQECIELETIPVATASVGPAVLAATPDPEFADEISTAGYLDAVLGAQDIDEDGIANPADMCPLIADLLQENTDGDARGDACDCAPAGSAAWARPAEVLDLAFSDAETLVWREPGFFGSTFLVYDTLRSSTPTDFVSALTCVESGDGSDLQATDLEIPSVGQAYYYLTRAVNDCPDGKGPLGESSSGVARTGAACP